jgi:putative two-component sensor
MTIDTRELLRRSLDLTARLDHYSALQAFVESAVTLTGARYGALSVLDPRGNTIQLVYSGVESMSGELIGHPPMGYGLFGDMPDDSYIIRNDLADEFPDPPWPDDHPPMGNFLGVPLMVRGRSFGHLYLAEKQGDFSTDDGEAIMMLARAASIAVENSRLFAESVVRAQWIAASRAISTALLEGKDEEDALQLIAHEMRRVAKADVALIVLEGVAGAWTCEIADGEGAGELIGIDFPPTGRAQSVIRDGQGMIVDSMSRQAHLQVPTLASYGSALYAPMAAKGSTMGVIVLLRAPDKQEFDLSDLAMAEAVAKQAALALELADARHIQAQASQLEERAQISRDLHDLAIQQLFASGMELTAVRNDLADSGAAPKTALESLDNAISSIDESVGQIRQIIYSLRDPHATVPFVARLRREIEHGGKLLGFHPNLEIVNLGRAIDGGLHTEIDDELGADVSDDVAAVVRECIANAAKHAKAKSVDVAIAIENHRISVKVIDDGQGISRDLNRRSGLSNLAARARRHHGTFSIRPGDDGAGTKIEWTALID